MKRPTPKERRAREGIAGHAVGAAKPISGNGECPPMDARVPGCVPLVCPRSSPYLSADVDGRVPPNSPRAETRRVAVVASLAWHDDHAEANGWSYQLNSLREVGGASDWWVLVRPPGSNRYTDRTFLDPPLSAVPEAPRSKEGSKTWARRTAEQHADEVAERLRSSRPRGETSTGGGPTSGGAGG